MERQRFFSWIAGLSAAIVAAASLVTVTAQPVAPSATSVAPASKPSEITTRARVERLLSQIDARRQELHIPGVAFALVRGNDVLALRGFGVRDVEQQTPVTPDTLFAIGSSTKSFTSMLVAMLVDEGKMAWDESAHVHLPDFHLQDPEADDQVALRDLLCHRTGLTRLSLLWAKGDIPRETVLAHVRDAKPLAPFRKAFLYNNVTYMAAGMAAEAAAGESWETLIAERIFKPLGMRASNTSTAAALRDPHHALGYQWEESTASWTPMPMRSLASIAPAGAINSSASEMSHWLRFLVAKGEYKGKRLVSKQRLDEMWTPQIAMGGGVSYGMGWMLQSVAGKRAVHHGGNIDGFSSMVGLYPDDAIGFALFANVTATPLQQEVVQMVADTMLSDDQTFAASGARAAEHDQAADAVADSRPDDVEPYVGVYHLDALKRNVTVLERDGRLALDVPGQTVFTLKWPDDQGRWVFELTDAIAVTFTAGDDGVMASLTVHQNGANMLAKRVDEKPAFTIEDVDALRDKVGKLPNAFRLIGAINMVNQGLTGLIDVVADGQRIASKLDIGVFGSVRTAYDGKRGWQKTPGAPMRELQGAELEQMRLEALTSAGARWADLYTRAEPLRRDTLDGRDVFVVRLFPKAAPPVTAYVDAERGWVVKRETSILLPGGVDGLPLTTTYGDFRQVGASYIPFHVESMTTAQGTTIIDIEKIDLNPTIDQGRFLAPTENEH